MHVRPPYSLLVAAAVWMLAAPAAGAFTIEDKDAAGQYAVPKFDLEEQSKTFRKDGSGATGPGTSLYETPFGGGKLQFGVTQGGGSSFGSNNSAAQRRHFDRMLSAPSSLDFDSSR